MSFFDRFTWYSGNVMQHVMISNQSAISVSATVSGRLSLLLSFTLSHSLSFRFRSLVYFYIYLTLSGFQVFLVGCQIVPPLPVDHCKLGILKSFVSLTRRLFACCCALKSNVCCTLLHSLAPHLVYNRSGHATLVCRIDSPLGYGAETHLSHYSPFIFDFSLGLYTYIQLDALTLLILSLRMKHSSSFLSNRVDLREKKIRTTAIGVNFILENEHVVSTYLKTNRNSIERMSVWVVFSPTGVVIHLH